MFMVFEVWDLDGSDLCRRVFHLPLPSQPMVDVAGALRHGILATSKAPGHAYTLSSWPPRAAHVCLRPPTEPKRFAIHPTRIRAHLERRRAAHRTPPPDREAFRPTFRAI
jgi:hypothetical protein